MKLLLLALPLLMGATSITWEIPATRVNGDVLPIDEIHNYTLKVCDIETTHLPDITRHETNQDISGCELSIYVTDTLGMRSKPTKLAAPSKVTVTIQYEI